MSTPSTPFEPIKFSGESLTIDVEGDVLIIPTGDPDVLPLFNEFCTGRVLTPGTYTFTNDTDTDNGLQHLIYPVIACLCHQESKIDFYLFTQLPENLECVVNSSGVIVSLTLYPGDGTIYHGQTTYSDLSIDSDSDLVPDALKQKLNLAAANGELLKTADGAYLNVNMPFNGSLFRFLRSYGMIT
jgi:hypothetical protein